jgi:hypothetical protein
MRGRGSARSVPCGFVVRRADREGASDCDAVLQVRNLVASDASTARWAAAKKAKS